MNLRFEALAAVSRNPGAPLDELVGMLSVSGKPARQAVLDAKKGGLLSLMRDDVTGQPGYILTDAGKKRLADGPDKLNGSNMVKGVQPERLKKAAEKAQPKAQPVAAAPEHDDINVADLMPPADPVLLASANRMLSERLAGVAHALRGSGLASQRDVDDSEDLQPHVAALAGAYQMRCARLGALLELIESSHNALAPYVGGEIDPTEMDLDHIAEAVALNVVNLMADLASQRNLNEVLKRNFGSKARECEALRKSLESAKSGDGRPIAGYTTGDLDEIHLTIEGARESAEFATIQSGLEMNVYELSLVGTAKRAAEWVPA